MKLVTTFPQRGEFGRAQARLDALGLAYDVVDPAPGYAHVGVPAVVMEPEARQAMAARDGQELYCSGWVDYRPAHTGVPEDAPEAFAEDVFGKVGIMVVAPCVADETKIRLVAHIAGDMTDAFPYLNTDMAEASYNKHGPTFTFMDGYRMVNLFPRRVTIAKADELVDAWRELEAIRRRVNEVWARREEIEPSYEMRRRPPALEIFKRLPGTNCRACGERTCLAFAAKVQAGEIPVRRCRPVFEGDFVRLRDALIDICSGLAGASG